MTLSAHIDGSCIVPAVQQGRQGHRLLLTLSSVAVSRLTFILLLFIWDLYLQLHMAVAGRRIWK